MKAIVLLSGGLDSTVILAHALSMNRECLAVSFDYGQRHLVELNSAKAVAAYYQIPHRIITLDPAIFGDSSLLSNSKNLDVPKNRSIDLIKKSSTPSTYVPARNTVFLSLCLAQAELFSAEEIYIGPNAMDTKYPDCSQAFIDSFQNLIQVATKQSLNGNPPKLIAPLLTLNKLEILELGLKMNAPIHLSFSCYDPAENGAPCKKCDACIIRQDAFNKHIKKCS